MNPCARCKGSGDEADEGEFRACQMCGGDGAAVPCQKRRPMKLPGFVFLCNRPSVAWDDESPRCHRHDPDVVRAVRGRVARARERVKA